MKQLNTSTVGEKLLSHRFESTVVGYNPHHQKIISNFQFLNLNQFSINNFQFSTKGNNPNCRRETDTNELSKNLSRQSSRIPTPQQLKLPGSGDRGCSFLAFFSRGLRTSSKKKAKKNQKIFSKQFSISNIQFSINFQKTIFKLKKELRSNTK